MHKPYTVVAVAIFNESFRWEIRQRIYDGKIVFTCTAVEPDYPEGLMVNDADTIELAKEQAEAESCRKFTWTSN